MKHSVKAGQVSLGQVSQILANFGDCWEWHPKISAIIEIYIKTGHLVSGRTKHGRRYGSYIALVPCEKYFHVILYVQLAVEFTSIDRSTLKILSIARLLLRKWRSKVPKKLNHRDCRYTTYPSRQNCCWFDRRLRNLRNDCFTNFQRSRSAWRRSVAHVKRVSTSNQQEIVYESPVME